MFDSVLIEYTISNHLIYYFCIIQTQYRVQLTFKSRYLKWYSRSPQNPYNVNWLVNYHNEIHCLTSRIRSFSLLLCNLWFVDNVCIAGSYKLLKCKEEFGGVKTATLCNCPVVIVTFLVLCRCCNTLQLSFIFSHTLTYLQC